MANIRSSNTFSEYASVDSAVGVGGYFTTPVSFKVTGVKNYFFSIRELDPAVVSVATVFIQFKCEGDDHWTDYIPGIDLTVGVRLFVEAGGSVQWRAGIKEAVFTSGGIVFGFDW